MSLHRRPPGVIAAQASAHEYLLYIDANRKEPTMELVLDRLTKQYGPKIAVDRVSARLRPGVYGLLGANGAGKTTIMRMICGILRPSSGEISLDGRSIAELGGEYRARLGYLPQDFGYYPEFTARTSWSTWRRSRRRRPRRARPVA